jgi:hypothetical protein
MDQTQLQGCVQESTAVNQTAMISHGSELNEVNHSLVIIMTNHGHCNPTPNEGAG